MGLLLLLLHTHTHTHVPARRLGCVVCEKVLIRVCVATEDTYSLYIILAHSSRLCVCVCVSGVRPPHRRVVKIRRVQAGRSSVACFIVRFIDLFIYLFIYIIVHLRYIIASGTSQEGVGVCVEGGAP